jgi:hypothetical protein
LSYNGRGGSSYGNNRKGRSGFKGSEKYTKKQFLQDFSQFDDVRFVRKPSGIYAHPQNPMRREPVREQGFDAYFTPTEYGVGETQDEALLNLNARLKRTLGLVHFLGSCDHFRQTPEGEEQWQTMMQTKKPISEKDFLKKVDVHDVLDEGETWNEYKDNARREGSPLEFYESSNGLIFFQTAGFEFIWRI